jgi:pyridoxal phosphate enzyme (YggS family)
MLSHGEIKARIDDVRAEMEIAAARSGRRLDAIRLIAVTKTHPADLVQMVVDAGVSDIGENRVQELLAKAPVVTGSVVWHLIGHLQTNKVRKVIDQAAWIQTVDSDRLADELDIRATALSQKIKVLIEVNTSKEASKSGCDPLEARPLCEKVAASRSMEFCGLMTVGPLGGGETATRRAFQTLRSIGESVRQYAPRIELSMGMSGDFGWAIEEGSTMVRIGTRLLGDRGAAQG